MRKLAFDRRRIDWGFSGRGLIFATASGVHLVANPNWLSVVLVTAFSVMIALGLIPAVSVPSASVSDLQDDSRSVPDA